MIRKICTVVTAGLILCACSNQTYDNAAVSPNTKILDKQYAPNGKCYFTLSEVTDNLNRHSTRLFISFKGCGSLVYNPSGKDLGIKVFWKNNNTIVVESKKDIHDPVRRSFAQCFFEKVNIKYIEL